MANTEKPNLTGQIEKWSKYLGLVSGILAIVTSLTGDPLIAYASLGILALGMVEYWYSPTSPFEGNVCGQHVGGSPW